MSEYTIALYLVGGSLLLYYGAEMLVKGGASLAFRMGLPILVIGLTIMGYGTGMPELMVSVEASIANKGDIVVGNVIGSNIANTALILAFSAICRPISIKSQLVKHDGPVMVLVSIILCFLIGLKSSIGRGEGILLVLGLALHTWWTIRIGRKEKEVVQEVKEEIKEHLLVSFKWGIVFIVIGFIFLFFGGKLFLDGAIALSRRFGISDAVIGLTIVAIGTSLPEFATSIVALYRGHEDIALGNVVGSNIFNVLAIIGVASLINPIILVGIDWVDYSYMALLAAFLWLTLQSCRKIYRWHGAVMLLSFFLYMSYLVLAKS